jgi:aminoglycoside phosphotransferase (APT) family kinase protein
MNAAATDQRLADMTDLDASISQFIASEIGRPADARIGKRYAGGFSWRTYDLEVVIGRTGDQVEERLNLILRIGHAQGLLSPYSTRPEAWVFEALAGSRVPVPRLLWHTDDASILGSPFLVMEKALGAEISPFARAEPDAGALFPLGEHFVDVLAALHNQPWQGTPAAMLEPRVRVDDAALIQVDKWSSMIDESGLGRRPILHRARSWLKSSAPKAPRVCIVHGDYRAGNFLYSNGRITAVLDWEMVHLGDPHEDIAWAGLRFLSGRSALVSGIISRDKFRHRYEHATGTMICDRSVGWYELLALYKICAMNLRAASRVEAGTAPDARMTALGLGLPQLEVEIAKLLLDAE